MQGNPLMPPDLLMSAFLSLINNRMGAKRIKNRPQRAGPMVGVSRVGHWESGNTPGYVRAQRERALLWRAIIIQHFTTNGKVPEANE